MRTLTLIAIVITFCVGFQGISQTPDDQKKIEEMQRQAAEAQKKAMEMMSDNPQFQEAMKMMEDADAQQKQEEMRGQVEEEKRQKEATKDHLKEFYWRNKVASNTQGAFDNWQWGSVEIAYYDGKGKLGSDGRPPYEHYVIVGMITGSGKVEMNLPTKVTTNRTIKTGLFPQMHEILNDEVEFTNPNAQITWSGYGFAILRGEEVIGNLYIGNSERSTHNLASPSAMKYGDEGYLLYWAYTDDSCRATFDKKDANKTVYEGEASKVIDQYTTVDMDLKPGWNLVKIEVNGFHTIDRRSRWKFKTYTTVDQMPSDARYYFKYE
ncbi:MAG: hypothetical protein ABF293_07390 [Flavobacteriaceae bacterium]